MAIGASVQDEDGTELATVSKCIGHGTNNIAEYMAAIDALKIAKALGATVIELRMDSELVVRQITGAYKVRNEALTPLHVEVTSLLASFDKHAVSHVPREENQRADELANMAFRDMA
jgi:ribonuclease HI